jgi:hypothetical protein
VTPSRRAFLSALSALPVAARLSRPAPKPGPVVMRGMDWGHADSEVNVFYVAAGMTWLSCDEFVVPYQGVQAALDAATDAGGGIVYLFPGHHEG